MTFRPRLCLRTAAALCFAAALFPSVADSADTLPAPVLRYRFDSIRGTRVRDASGHGHDGRLEIRNPARAKSPLVRTPYGPALKLAEGDGVRVRMAPDLACRDALTVMAWARPDVVNRHLAVVTAKGDRVPNQKAAGYRISISWRAAFGELGFGDPEGVRISTPGFSVEPKHWVHVALTFDGTDMILYLNAVEAARKHFPEKRRIRPFPGRDLTIGKYYWHDAYPFEGLLADVRIYDRALTPEQVFLAAAQWLGAP